MVKLFSVFLDGVSRISSRSLSFFDFLPSSQIGHAFLWVADFLGYDVDSIKEDIAVTTLLYFDKKTLGSSFEDIKKSLYIPFPKNVFSYVLSRSNDKELDLKYSRIRKRIGVANYGKLVEFYNKPSVDSLNDIVKDINNLEMPEVKKEVIPKKSNVSRGFDRKSKVKEDENEGYLREGLYNEVNLYIKPTSEFRVGFFIYVPLSIKDVKEIVNALSLIGLGGDKSTGGGFRLSNDVLEVNLGGGNKESLSLGLVLFDDRWKPVYGRLSLYDVVFRKEDNNVFNKTFLVVREGALFNTSGLVGSNQHFSEKNSFVGRTISLPLG